MVIFPIKTLVFRLSNKDRRMCLVGEIKSLPAVVNWICAAEIRTVTGTWLFPSGFGHSRVPQRAPISAKRRLNSKAITISGPTFSRNRRTSEILSKIRKNAIFPEKRDFGRFSGKTPFSRKNAIFGVYSGNGHFCMEIWRSAARQLPF